MDVKIAINERKSIRKYQEKEVSSEILLELIDAARLAPSGNNAQPWKFKIITDKSLKQKLRENNIFPQDFVYSVPAIILCCADPTEYKKNVSGLDDANNLRAVRDLSIATSFLLLRATELGLGTCYVGWMKKEEILNLLELPSEYVVPYIITVGYPAESPDSKPRKNIDEILIK
ncbi:nitroreductase [Candidatus Woesearchaeota archaeon]|jgi:nitroreductase|nr:nitroreductase [Candidatus Woesearchaeota archaeon]